MTGTGGTSHSSTVSAASATLEPQLYYIHTDHLGTPQELTDRDGQLHWTGHYRAWGELAKANDNEGNAANVEMPLRFQGQYCDAETGLHYNRFRYYDPKVGRFTTQDPISLGGGLNLYQYAPNPVQWVDPLGLAGCPERDKRVQHIIEKYGGKKREDGGFDMPNKKSAKQAASEISGDLGSLPQKVRRKDYSDELNDFYDKKSDRVIGKISSDKKAGYYDHSIGHRFDRRPHINVWSDKYGATAKDNFHLYY